MKIALFSAFPHELTHVRKNSTPVKHAGFFPMFLKKQACVELLIVETGMGKVNSEAALSYILNAGYSPDAVLSAGFGGALYRHASIGELIFASRYLLMTNEGVVELPQLSDGNSATAGAMLYSLKKSIGTREGSFLTLRTWTAKSKLKALVPAGVPFPVCDRETVYLAKIARMNYIPFFALRSITDTLDEDIPEELFSVAGDSGNYRLSKAAVFLISRPYLILEGLKLGRRAALASRSLGDAVNAFIETASTQARTRRGRTSREHTRS
jgi:nucleoside phosphorylase